MRLMSGRFRAYAATMPATVPVAKSTTISTATTMPPNMWLRRRRVLGLGICHGTQDSVDESSGILGREALRKRDRLIDRHRRRRFRPAVQFERRHFEDQSVDRR